MRGTVVTGTQLAVMEADFSGNVRVFHPRIRAVVTAIQSIAPPYRDVSAESLKQLAAKELAGARDVLQLREAMRIGVPVHSVGVLDEGRAGNAKSRIRRKTYPEGKRSSLARRNVGIEIADHIEGQIAQTFRAGIEAMRFRGELPVRRRACAVGGSKDESGIASDDFVGAIG